jgi:hypothetical protein
MGVQTFENQRGGDQNKDKMMQRNNNQYQRNNNQRERRDSGRNEGGQENRGGNYRVSFVTIFAKIENV